MSGDESDRVRHRSLNGELTEATSRNRAAIAAGRLRLVHGETGAVSALDLILAVRHLLLGRSSRASAQLRAALAPGGILALGLPLARDIPARPRDTFPQIGGRVYETEDDIGGFLFAAGFRAVEFRTKPDRPGQRGRPILATP